MYANTLFYVQYRQPKQTPQNDMYQNWRAQEGISATKDDCGK